MAPGFWHLTGLKKYDLETGRTQRWHAPEGCYLSEAPFAPRLGAVQEDDGYLVTYLVDTGRRQAQCAVFDARDITQGPVCRVMLPGYIPLGAHAYWAPSQDLHRVAA
jgi:carotenoid cleavage dioxygenase